MAKKFIRRIQGHFERLLATIHRSTSPALLKEFSEIQTVDELAQFAQLFAEVWQQKADILAREKLGLEYLSHEMRTPIQSSLATLELLALKTEDKKIIDRLTRSLKRMTRLSNAVLYLMESDKTVPTCQVDLVKICVELVDELQPLADVKQQTIEIKTAMEKTQETHAAGQIVATPEVIETLLSILLSNALQHSNSHPIEITIGNDQVSIKNEVRQVHAPVSSHPDQVHEGFGIGLTIAKRLADKFHLQLSVSFIKHGQVIATISRQ